MANIVVIDKDVRNQRQVKEFLKDLEDDSLKLQIFSSSKEFSDLYFPPTKTKNSDASTKPLRPLNLIIFKLEGTPQQAMQWLETTRSALEKKSYFPKDNVTRFMLFKYEDDNIPKVSLLSPFLDDIIYLPMDQSLFLQKVDTLLNLPKKATPRFLFSQDTQLDIEIAKLSQMEFLSDVGLAISNPVRLSEGLLGHFYINTPSLKKTLNAYGKVIKSMPHPEAPNKNLIYFNFFGLGREELTVIRSLLTQGQNKYKPFLNDNSEDFLPKKTTDSKEEHSLPAYCLGVIDQEPQNIQDILDKNIGYVETFEESSYSMFLKKYLASKPTNSVDFSKVELAVEADFAPMSWLVHSDSHELRKVTTSLDEDVPYFGHSFEEFMEPGQNWLKAFKVGDNLDLITECIQTAASGLTLHRIIALQNSSGSLKAVKLTFKKDTEDDSLVAISMDLASEQDFLRRKNQKSTALKKLDGLIINANFIPEDKEAWLKGLHELAKNKGVKIPSKGIPIILISEDDRIQNPDSFSDFRFRGFIYKPLDSRQLLFAVSKILNNKHTMYNFDNIGWTPQRMNIQISKPAKMIQVSEYGGSIEHPRPIMPGTFLFLRKAIYDNAPNNNLCARFYHVQANPNDKNLYTCSFLYFGINDGFLKTARSWFREIYATSKQNA